MVHGCRQLVSWDVRLSPATSATLILSYYHLVEHSKETARVIGRKVGTTSNHHASYEWGYTRATMVWTKRRKFAKTSKSHKPNLSSDWSLQLDFMKSESLVIADQHAAVNTFPGLVHTARHTTKVCNTRNRDANSQERLTLKVLPVIGVKS